MDIFKSILNKFQSLTRKESDLEAQIQKEETDKKNKERIEMKKTEYCSPNSFLRGKTSNTGIVDVNTSNYLSGRENVLSEVITVNSLPPNPSFPRTCDDTQNYVYMDRRPRKKENGLSEIDTSSFDYDYYPSHERYSYNSFNFYNSRK